MSARFAVIGDPVQHSLSPRIFSWLLQETGEGGAYEALHVRPPELAATVQRLRTGELQGVSVTIPHKEAVLKLVEVVDPHAASVGASNCLARQADGQVRAFNTDTHGVKAALDEHQISVAGGDVVILGAGGAARAAAFAMGWAGAARVSVANRGLARAKALVSDLARAVPAVVVEALPLEGARLTPVVAGARLLINATSVGLNDPAASPLPEGVRVSGAVMDMVYRPLETRLLRDAQADGAPVRIDGLWMLVFQALGALRIWTGFEGDASLGRRLYQYLRKELS